MHYLLMLITDLMRLAGLAFIAYGLYETYRLIKRFGDDSHTDAFGIPLDKE